MKTTLKLLVTVAALLTAGERARGGTLPVPPGRLYAVLTKPGALPSGQGHVQGMCVSSNAVYMSILKGLCKFDWKGNLIASVACAPHAGDICLWKGRIYLASCGADNNAISVYDENLSFVKRTAVSSGADGITCLDGVLYVGLGPVNDPKRPFRGNWFGKFDAETLQPLGKPFVVDHGYGTWLGVQNIATDGESLFVGVYTPDEETPNFIRFDRNFKRLGVWTMGVGHGLDALGGGRDGAVRFVHAWTLTGSDGCPQALLRFAELKGNELSDVTKYETYAYEHLRERTVLDDLMPRPVKTEIVRYPHSKLAKSKLKDVAVVTAAVPGAPAATAKEAYLLEIGGKGVTVTAPGPDGERWARRTLGLLARLSQTDTVPCCRITDWPKSARRVFSLDTSRTEFSARDICAILDFMSLYKLNTLRWHRAPRESQEKVRDVLAHAELRGIAVLAGVEDAGSGGAGNAASLETCARIGEAFWRGCDPSAQTRSPSAAGESHRAAEELELRVQAQRDRILPERGERGK